MSLTPGTPSVAKTATSVGDPTDWDKIEEEVRTFEAFRATVRRWRQMSGEELLGEFPTARKSFDNYIFDNNGTRIVGMAGSASGSWVYGYFDRVARKPLADARDDMIGAAAALWPIMDDRGVYTPEGSRATITPEDARLAVAFFADQLDRYAKEVQALLDQAGPVQLMYSGFPVSNPKRVPDTALRKLLDGLDYTLALFRSRGAEKLLRATLRQVVITEAMPDETPSAYYYASKQLITVFSKTLNVGSGRFLKDWVHEVFLHEVGHHVHMHLLHPEAVRQWDAPWGPADEAEAAAIRKYTVSYEERQAFLKLVERSGWNPSKAGARLKGLDRLKFLAWLYHTQGNRLTVSPGRVYLTGYGRNVFKFLSDPDAYMKKIYPDTWEYTQDQRDRQKETYTRAYLSNLGVTPAYANEHYPQLDRAFIEKAMAEDRSLTLEPLGIPSGYGKTNKLEDFAETFVLFMTEPHRLSETARGRMARALSMSGLYGKPILRNAVQRVVRRWAARTGKFYLFTTFPLTAGLLMRRSSIYSDDGSLRGLPVPVFDGERYAKYRRNLVEHSLGSSDNYIYRIDRPLRLFDGSVADLWRLHAAGAMDLARIASYWGIKDTSDLEQVFRVLARNLKERHWFLDLITVGTDTEQFRRVFDGFDLGKHPTPMIYADLILQHAKLIDGAAVRYDPGETTDGEFVFPTDILVELKRYTDDPGKRLAPGAVAWLKEHAPKPYTSKRLYRGFGMQFDDWGEYDKVTLPAVEKHLFSRTGLRRLGTLRVHASIKVKRGKESSWSTVPQVAKAFGSGMARKSLNLLVVADVPASRIIVDFTTLPRELRQQFKFHGQSEVIVDAGPIEATVSNMWVDERFNNWLKSHGYRFMPQRGIFSETAPGPPPPFTPPAEARVAADEEYHTKDGRPITFKAHEKSWRHPDQNMEPWVVHLIEAYVDGKEAGHLTISYIPKATPFTLWGYMKHRGWRGADLEAEARGDLDALWLSVRPYLTGKRPEEVPYEERVSQLKYAERTNRREYLNTRRWHVDKPHVDYILVMDEWRRQGIGTALYTYGARWLARTHHLPLYASTLQSEAAKVTWEAMRNRGLPITKNRARKTWTLDYRVARRWLAARGLKVWLDDERPAPPGWTRARWPDEVIRLLKTGRVTDISLDHDLGDDSRGTGYDVVLWVEEAVATRGFVPPKMQVHSANSSARVRMEAGIRSIERLTRGRTAAAKEPWQMLLAEFWATGVKRTVSRKATPFDAWIRIRGVNPAEVATEFEEADYLGAMLFPQSLTGMQRGKIKGLERKVQRRRELRQRYEVEVGDVVWAVPAKENRSVDVALVRSLHKREIRKALRDGKPVPLEVLAEYPEFSTLQGSR